MARASLRDLELEVCVPFPPFEWLALTFLSISALSMAHASLRDLELEVHVPFPPFEWLALTFLSISALSMARASLRDLELEVQSPFRVCPSYLDSCYLICDPLFCILRQSRF